jgi:hypothetical protein
MSPVAHVSSCVPIYENIASFSTHMETLPMLLLQLLSR